uniref:acylphosphatase n=1 Tax=Candidatus Methanophagaceae archaeon ANME-1 ERB6 TaxID=2759912 RepID=A0A7G9YYR0_9EURY|nr:acylphosphatase [Methanosarcinales archaeon ANME-1 ERB6]
MKRADIRIKGNVQMVGFRTVIKNTADSLNVKGFAENLEDGSVKVICEGEEEGINELINSIKEKTPSFASIEEMNVAYEEYKGEFTGFERRGADVPKEDKEDAMLRYMRSFDKKGEVMIGILNSMDETMKSVKEDTSHMLEKQDMMLEKQDETIGAIREVSEKIEGAKEEIVTEIGSLRETFL